MRVAQAIVVSEEDRKTLRRWTRAARLVLRANIVLLAAAGKLNKDIAREQGSVVPWPIPACFSWHSDVDVYQPPTRAVSILAADALCRDDAPAIVSALLLAYPRLAALLFDWAEVTATLLFVWAAIALVFVLHMVAIVFAIIDGF